MQSKPTLPPRPEVGMNYTSRQGKQVLVFAVCQTHVVYRHLPLYELGVDKRNDFAQCYMNKDK